MKSNLFTRGFLSLLATQFFGAANDNILKQMLTLMVATGLWKGALGPGGQSYIALCLTIPFIILSALAGQVADRHSKRSVMLGVKIAEIPIVTVALVGLWTQTLWLTMASFLFLAIQSTFFGPAKYGVVPELVDEGELSRANGTLNMLTNIAIILGIMAAGPVSDLYFPMSGNDPDPTRAPILWLPGAVLLATAVMGLGSVLWMPRLKACDPTLKFVWNPLTMYLKALREMAQGPLLIIALAWSFFYLVGMMALLILPEYKNFLTLDGELITFTENSYLFGTLAVAIGIGSVLAGIISGHHIKPRLVVVGAIGMTLSFIVLGVLPDAYWLVMAMLLVSGLFAGFYIVPLQALLQKLSPDDERGRFLGTANAMSFVFSSMGALIYWAAANIIAKMSAGADVVRYDRVFIVCGVLAVLATGYALYKLRHMIREHATV